MYNRMMSQKLQYVQHYLTQGASNGRDLAQIHMPELNVKSRART
jgi:hypothetical protein